jgi:cytochrome c biogenesis protein CcmG/thiol:disulfide interchange protein DsbE
MLAISQIRTQLAKLYRREKRLLLLLFVALVMIALQYGWSRMALDHSTPPASPAAGEALAARINGEPFSLAELERELAFDRAIYKLVNGRELVLQDMSGTLQGLLPTLLLDQQARRAGVAAGAEEVTAALEGYAASRNFSLETLAQELQPYGYDVADFREKIARTVRIEAYLDEVMADPDRAPPDLPAWLDQLQDEAEIDILYEPPQESPLLGRPAPAFSLANLRGESVSLAQFQGRPVVLNFWATWCIPCREEMPLLQQAYERHQERGLAVLAVNFEEETALIRPFVEELQLTFDILPDRQAEVSKSYRITGLPITVFIDRQGLVRHIQLGQLKDDTLAEALAKIL